MKKAIARPRIMGSLKISAHTPPTTAIGLEAVMPHSNRKIRKNGQLGARAHAMVNIVKKTKVTTMMIRRP